MRKPELFAEGPRATSRHQEIAAVQAVHPCFKAALLLGPTSSCGGVSREAAQSVGAEGLTMTLPGRAPASTSAPF